MSLSNKALKSLFVIAALFAGVQGAHAEESTEASSSSSNNGPRFMRFVMGTGVGADPSPGILSFSIGLEFFESLRVSCGRGVFVTDYTDGCGARFSFASAERFRPYVGFSVIDYAEAHGDIIDGYEYTHDIRYMPAVGASFRPGRVFELSIGGAAMLGGNETKKDLRVLDHLFPNASIALRF